MRKGIALFLVLLISGCSVTDESRSQFALEVVPIEHDGETRHIKYNRITGEAWWASNTNWFKIEDEDSIPRSVYEIKIVPMGSSWRAIRIDKNSGDTWKNSRGKWVPFTEAIKQ